MIQNWTRSRIAVLTPPFCIVCSLALISTYLKKAHDNKDDQIPWGTLRYLIGEAMYGGRVSDSFDRRILATYLDEYLGDFLFDKFHPFHFYKNEADAVDYKLPDYGTKENYTTYIDSLPIVQTPEVFGLHPNADISYYTITTKRLWKDLINLQPRTAGAIGGVKREDVIDKVAQDLLSKIPEPYDLPVIKKEIGIPTPVQVFDHIHLHAQYSSRLTTYFALHNLKQVAIFKLLTEEEPLYLEILIRTSSHFQINNGRETCANLTLKCLNHRNMLYPSQ